MPKYAFLEHPLTCTCGNVVSPDAIFFWGYCHGRRETVESTYQMGDAIRWHLTADGQKPAWTYFTHRTRRPGYTDASSYVNYAGGNLGDPAYQDLIVTFPASGWDHGYPEQCSECSRKIAGSAIRIKGGRIVDAWLYAPGDPLDQEDTDTFVYEGDILVPRPDWYDHGMDTLECEIPPYQSIMAWLSP